MKHIYLVFTLFGLFFAQELLAAEYKSVYLVDITGDGNDEVITYQIQKNSEKYDASIKIETKSSKVLWDHQYQMTKADLFDDLLMNEGNISLEHWVKHFFDGSLVYGAKFEKSPIREDEINMEFLGFYSKSLNHSAQELRNLILAEKVNSIFYYRASWREELVMLVYIPKLKKMIHFSGGEY